MFIFIEYIISFKYLLSVLRGFFNIFQKARKRNEELSENCKDLEEERKLISGRLEDSQFEMVTQKNNLNSLLEQLKSQKSINMAQAQRLQICNEQLESLQSEIDKAVRNLYYILKFFFAFFLSCDGLYLLVTFSYFSWCPQNLLLVHWYFSLS